MYTVEGMVLNIKVGNTSIMVCSLELLDDQPVILGILCQFPRLGPGYRRRICTGTYGFVELNTEQDCRVSRQYRKLNM